MYNCSSDFLSNLNFNFRMISNMEFILDIISFIYVNSHFHHSRKFTGDTYKYRRFFYVYMIHIYGRMILCFIFARNNQYWPLGYPCINIPPRRLFPIKNFSSMILHVVYIWFLITLLIRRMIWMCICTKLRSCQTANCN